MLFVHCPNRQHIEKGTSLSMERPDVKRTHCSYVLYYSCIMVLCIPQYFAHLYMHYALHTITCTTTPADDLALAICAGESLGAGFRSSLQAFVDPDSIHLKETVCFWINMFLSIAQCKLQPLACRQLPLLAAKSLNHQVLAPDPLGFHETPNCPPQKGCDSYIMDSGWSQRLMLDAKRLDS